MRVPIQVTLDVLLLVAMVEICYKCYLFIVVTFLPLSPPPTASAVSDFFVGRRVMNEFSTQDFVSRYFSSKNIQNSNGTDASD